MEHESDGRATELRRVLVDTVNSARPRPTVPRRWFLAGIAAFVVAGAATGGAISAVALANAPEPSTSAGLAVLHSSMAGAEHATIGPPFLIDGNGDSTIDLGVRPDAATGVVIALGCAVDGRLEAAIDGATAVELQCGATTAPDMTATRVDVGADGTHTLTIHADGAYAAWASWVEPESQRSAQQEAQLADGVVTAEEYHAAFARFGQCMTEAGHPLGSVADAGTVIEYDIPSAAFTSGDYIRCYQAEFEEVDKSWQFAQPTS